MARPPVDQFYKRVNGQLQWDGTGGEFSIHVDDVDHHWLTTDKCATLDVTFQLTLDTGTISAGSTKAFPLTTVTVQASDGTADVKLPASAAQTGTLTAVSITDVAARACGASAPAPAVASSCPASPEQQLQLLDVKKALVDRGFALSLFYSQQDLAIKQFESKIESSKEAIAAGEKDQAWGVFTAVVTLALVPIEAPAAAAVGGALTVVGISDVIRTILDDATNTSNVVYTDLKGVTMSEEVNKVVTKMSGLAEAKGVHVPKVWASDLLGAVELLKGALDLNDLKGTLAALEGGLSDAKNRLAATRAKLDVVDADLKRLDDLCPAGPR